MRQREARARNLTLSPLIAQLYAGLNDGEQSIHSGVAAGQSTSIGIHRQTPARPDRATGYELSTFPFAAEAEVFKKQQSVDTEGVIQLSDIDILRPHTSQLIGTLSRLAGSSYRQVCRLIHTGIPGRRRRRQHIYG